MTAPCSSPIGSERLVAYWADDLDADDTARVEEHLFGCAACTVEAERIARIAQALRGVIPPVIARAQLEELRARGLTIADTTFAPGVRQAVTFERHVDLMIHHLGGLDLATAERVEVTVRSEATGAVVHADPWAPFDRDRGEVLIACQRHFSHLPHDVVFDVRVHRASGPAAVATFVVPHVFDLG